MSYKTTDLTAYVKIKRIRRRFFRSIAFCDHSKSCQVCCWLWQGVLSFGNYGKFNVCRIPGNYRKRVYAKSHRFMYTIVYGHTSKLVLHTCDTPSCCNYNHMFTGTQKDNIADMWRKKRNKGNFGKGENHPNFKVTPIVIQRMKALRESGLTYKAIGELVGVHYKYVGIILRRLSRK